MNELSFEGVQRAAAKTPCVWQTVSYLMKSLSRQQHPYFFCDRSAAVASAAQGMQQPEQPLMMASCHEMRRRPQTWQASEITPRHWCTQQVCDDQLECWQWFNPSAPACCSLKQKLDDHWQDL